MSTHVLRRSRDPLDLLERVLNKTSLTTKRISHGRIINLGENLLEKTHVDIDGMKEAAVREALDAAERRHTRELRAALHRLQRQADDDKEKALTRQKKYYEDMARRVAEQRDKAEEEKIRELTKKFEREKEEALRKQWEECEKLKLQAVEEACAALHKKLRDEFAWEKERAIGEALAAAREKFRQRELETIERTIRECERRAAEEAARVAKLHAEEMARQKHRYNILQQKYEKEVAHKEKVERDFSELQTDYRRFMDYTDGAYHSDYMMHLRKHGLDLANKRVSVVSYEDVQKLTC